MSVAITVYTTYADIRAILGVAEEEITDNVVGLTVYAIGLNLALESVLGTLAPDTEERDLAEHHVYIDALSSPTDDQTKLLETIEIYATYIVADLLADSLPMSAPKTQTDGKSSLTRFSSQDTYNSVRANIKYGLAKYYAIINELFGVTPASAEYLKVVEPDVDVVTGEA